MKPDFYSLDPETQFRLALAKLNIYLPQAIGRAAKRKLSNTLNNRCRKWAARLGRAVFGLHPEHWREDRVPIPSHPPKYPK